MKKRDSGRGNRVGLSSLGFTTVLIVLLALLVFSILASITFGNADLSVKEVYSVVAYELFISGNFQILQKELSMTWYGSSGFPG